MLKTVGATPLVEYGFINAFWAIPATGLIIFLAGLPISSARWFNAADDANARAKKSRPCAIADPGVKPVVTACAGQSGCFGEKPVGPGADHALWAVDPMAQQAAPW